MAPKTAVKKIEITVVLLERIQKLLSHVWVAIIAGGKGERLFPKSNDEKTKPFVRCGQTGFTFMQLTFKRYLELGVNPENFVIIVCDDNQKKNAIADIDEFEEMTGVKIPYESIEIISDKYDYAGAQLKAARIIYRRDAKAIVIGTAADQYIEPNESFATCIEEGVLQAVIEGGCLTVVGIHTNDWNLIRGSGHAEYEITEDGRIREPVKIIGFVEKPDEGMAKTLLAANNNAVNTGINIFSAAYIVQRCFDIDLDELGKTGGLETKAFMDMIDKKYIVVGSFVWLDCGTATSVYQACKATPHHKNVTIAEGKSYVERTECINSLFWTCPEVNFYGVGCKDVCLVAERIYDQVVLLLIHHEYAQYVKQLLAYIRESTEKKGIYQLDTTVITDKDGKEKTVAIEAEMGNVLTNGNVRGKFVLYCLGVENYTVTPILTRGGMIDVCVENRSA